MTGKIAYITDSHLDEQFSKDHGVDSRKNWQIILNDVSKRNISKIVYGGDIGDPSSNRWFFETLKDYDLHVTLGNHDQFMEVVKHFPYKVDSKNLELFYSEESELYKYIFLDTSSGRISNHQMEWLSHELLPTKKNILFVHHPIFSINVEADRHYALKGREELKQQLLNTDYEIVIFCGHYHLSDHSIFGPIQQYITPASSVQIIKNASEIIFSGETFGYRIIDFSNSGIETELIMFKRESYI